jgi:hypothetical protein
LDFRDLCVSEVGTGIGGFVLVIFEFSVEPSFVMEDPDARAAQRDDAVLQTAAKREMEWRHATPFDSMGL